MFIDPLLSAWNTPGSLGETRAVPKAKALEIKHDIGLPD